MRVDFQGSRVTSDGGLLLVRELDERLRLTGLIQNHLVDSRTGRNTQFPLADLFRQSAYSRLAGYEDLNDVTRLARDPTFRLMGSKKVWERGVALTSTLHWFETDLLAREENLTGLARLNRELVARAEGVGVPHRVVLDMDSSESPVYGEQEQSAYNGYFEQDPQAPRPHEGIQAAAPALHGAEDGQAVVASFLSREDSVTCHGDSDRSHLRFLLLAVTSQEYVDIPSEGE